MKHLFRSTNKKSMDSHSPTARLSPDQSQVGFYMDDKLNVHERLDPGLVGNVVEVPLGPSSNHLLSYSKAETATIRSHNLSHSSHPNESLLLSLPSELICHILLFLNPLELALISSTCRLLAHHSKSDLCWQRHVQDNVPGLQLSSPFPCKNYRELYMAHDPHWFLSKYKIWFCDYFLTGKLILARYDPRRGCIEGYRLVAARSEPNYVPWELDDEVLIHSFNPTLQLHMDQPILQLDALSSESLVSSGGDNEPIRRWSAETPMRMHERNHQGFYSNFLLARPVEERPGMALWPPEIIPASSRVRNASQEAFVGGGHRPSKRSDICESAFRVRRWMEMAPGPNVPGVHLGEAVYTYATLDPEVYTPTEDKPWRGIFVGDYSGHGCEFLLMHQPDDEEPFDEASVVQREDETLEEWQRRKREEKIFRGKIEAIKLTGDPNVPRGEYTFVADDISEKGFIRIATEKSFKGARVVKSRGHVAARMFRDDRYIESQLMLISPDRLAQYWLGYGHISFYERVNIDKFLSPYDDPPPACPSRLLKNANRETEARVAMAHNYILRVTAGSEYDIAKHQIVPVNKAESITIESEHISVSLNVRIQNYRGLPKNSPQSSPYFDLPPHASAKDQYSIAFKFTPKKTINGNDLVFGNDFDHPIRDRLPPGFGTAFKIVKWVVDPGIDGDVYGDKPYLYGPAGSSVNVLHVGDKSGGQAAKGNSSEAEDVGLVFEEGGVEEGLEVRSEKSVPDTIAARKKFFLNEENRKNWEWEAGRSYGCDFYNPYLDFNEFALRLPGFTLPIMKYWDGQGLRYVLKDRSTDQLLFCVLFTLYLKEDVDEEGNVNEGVEGSIPLELRSEEERKKYAAAANGETVESHDGGKGEVKEAKKENERVVETGADDVD
ncbi:hypothetical protein HYALB_00002019 [Hymenoscyphus albidus]|uniref:F-box domain-containing protein n=1 Tax=Hymenoscyphus albidus TaxID=595503 RepID=A0A9N9LH20_9HELO|nr:hypothetical protein HYALB_00002019 [Hymenoscyphus albidus]